MDSLNEEDNQLAANEAENVQETQLYCKDVDSANDSHETEKDKSLNASGNDDNDKVEADEIADAQETEATRPEEEESIKNTEVQSDEEEFAGFGDEEIKDAKTSKKRQVLSDESDDNEDKDNDEEDEDTEKETFRPKKKKNNGHSAEQLDDANNEEEEEGHEAAAADDDDDDGGASDKEEKLENQDESNNADEEIESAQARQEKEADENSDEANDESESSRKKVHGKVSDLEAVLTKQREENKRRRRHNVDSEELNEMDNKISQIIAEMKNVAAIDRAANEKSMTTVQKLKMLPTVMNLLHKSDYHATMIELGMLSAIAEWLAPLPDRNLPNIKIREELIDALKDFGEINVDYLKSSGVGKAVMFLYKHPKETKANKQKLEKQINNWSRPIFNLDGNFKQLTKEERLQRDMEHVKSLHRRSSNETSQNHNVDDIMNPSEKHKKKKKKVKEDSNESSEEEEEESKKQFLRPGDPGFIPRARVPVPSSKDYVIRPKSNVEVSEMADKKVKKAETRFVKHKKRFTEIQKNAKSSRAVSMTISK